MGFGSEGEQRWWLMFSRSRYLTALIGGGRLKLSRWGMRSEGIVKLKPDYCQFSAEFSSPFDKLRAKGFNL